jgi:hypothetical protein
MKKRHSMAAGVRSAQRIPVHMLESDRFEVSISAGKRDSAAKFSAKPAESLSREVWTPDVEGWEPMENPSRPRIVLPMNLNKPAPPNGAHE